MTTCYFFILGKTKNSKKRSSVEEDKNRETPRCSSEQDSFTKKEQMWKFYSANDDDYKIAAQDEESDDFLTPISEEPESGEKLNIENFHSNCQPTTIKPVQGVRSPTLESPEDLENTERSLTGRPDSGDNWQREQVHPEIQASSIWKPRTSPLSHPNAQPDENNRKTNDEKSHEVPLDLTVREQVKPQENNAPRASFVSALNIEKRPCCNNSSDDDLSDEESFSTLAVFCQAKMNALYSGIPPDEEVTSRHGSSQNVQTAETKPTTVRDEIASRQNIQQTCHQDRTTWSTDNINPIVPIHLIRKDSPPMQKKIKYTHPNKIKVDLSMPFCSPESRVARSVPSQDEQHTKEESGNDEEVNYQTISEEPVEEKAMYTSYVVQGTSSEETIKANITSVLEEGEHVNQTGNQETDKSICGYVIPTSQEINASCSPIASATPDSHRLLLVQDLQGTDMGPPLFSKTNPVPIALLQQNEPFQAEIPGEVEKHDQDYNHFSVIEHTPEACSSNFRGNEKVNNLTQENATIISTTQSHQKLPSIEQIFKPISKTSVVTTPVVAANVEVSATSENITVPMSSNNVGIEISEATNHVERPRQTSHAPTDSKKTAIRQNKRNHTNNAGNLGWQNVGVGWNTFPSTSHVQYTYPCAPPQPSYARWPSPYPWAHYVPMAGRCPPYFPSPVPSYNPYAK